MATASQVAGLMRQALQDTNDWPGTAGDSPLKISTYRGAIDDKKYLSIDAGHRRKLGGADYQVPIRVIGAPTTLAAKFNPLIDTAFTNLNTAFTAYSANKNDANLSALETAAEQSEYLVQIFGQFRTLANTKVVEVTTEDEEGISLVISGEMGAGTTTDPLVTIIASAFLI